MSLFFSIYYHAPNDQIYSSKENVKVIVVSPRSIITYFDQAILREKRNETSFRNTVQTSKPIMNSRQVSRLLKSCFLYSSSHPQNELLSDFFIGKVIDFVFY